MFVNSPHQFSWGGGGGGGYQIREADEIVFILFTSSMDPETAVTVVGPSKQANKQTSKQANKQISK